MTGPYYKDIVRTVSVVSTLLSGGEVSCDDDDDDTVDSDASTMPPPSPVQLEVGETISGNSENNNSLKAGVKDDEIHHDEV